MVGTHAEIISFSELLFLFKDNCTPGCGNHKYGQLSWFENYQLQILTFPHMKEVFIKEKLLNKQKSVVPNSKGAIWSRILSLLDVREIKPGLFYKLALYVWVQGWWPFIQKHIF